MTEHNRSPNAAGQAAECGAMLRQAREDAGLDIAQVSQSLKVPMRIVSALEAGQWERLGAPVFVRGQLRSYARLLKVDVAPYLDGAEVGAVRPSDIVSHVHTPAYQRLFEATARRAVYVVITVCFFAVPVWLATRGPGPQTTASLDEAPTAPAAGELAPQVQKQQTEQAARRPDPSPLAASMTPPLSTTRDAPVAEASNSAGLRLSFRGDSWVQVIAADGTALEKGVLKAGDVRDFPAGQVQRVVLGNAAAVDVQRAGSTVALDPYRRGNVARFEVSSDGSLVPVQQ